MDKIKAFFAKIAEPFKKMTDKQKKIVNVTVTVIQIVAVLVAVTASIIILVNPAQGQASNAGTQLLPVLSDSMKGSEEFYAKNPDWKGFQEGDLLIARKPNGKKFDAEKLEVGDIVTFELTIGGNKELCTHRIVETGTDYAGNVYYYTKGDANPIKDSVVLRPDDVIAIHTGTLKGVGSAINWLQTPKNFFLVIVLPLILLFVYNIVLFIKMLMDQKAEKTAAQVKAQVESQSAPVIDEEEIKRKAIEEYLAKQAQAEAQTENQTENQASDNNSTGEEE